MKINVYIPQNALRDYVQSIMVFSLETEKTSPMPVNPFPPVPQHSLFFYLHDPIQTLSDTDEFITGPPTLIVGPQLSRVDIKMGHCHLMVHVGFKPGGLHQLIKVPMNELVDSSCSASDIIGPEADAVLEQLRNTTGWQQMVIILEKFLLEKLNRSRQAEPFDSAISALLAKNGNIPIEKVAATACLSLKQFERKCKERVGIPPKLFARLIRFSSAYRLRETNPQISWTSICYECGYFDQMHLIKDFKEFANVTPKIIANDLKKTPYRLQSNIQL
ncbi:helix-turn-helix domain-containing protein [Segetibacter aerophilus]|uniref:AraC family transcriptional regulator n=1 Tax=Segetibacter aerophilus TaxID=670293 RepID=A0A512BB95_9BACT|nr:helix-turn-helix domain-containing protein [Segetibacter aerophilus]GEO09241.1 AraC family transcriptional regulator [Segetibacter aerophilus]